MAVWKYNNLPESEISGVQKAVDERDLITLLWYHDTYKMSNVPYCCPDPTLLTFFDDLLNKRSI